jgi:hypothetical protein
MEMNISDLFKDSKSMQKGLITKNHISDIIKNLPYNDICYNSHEISLCLDDRNILEYIWNVIYETNYFFITFYKFGFYIPGYIKIIAFFTYCVVIYTLIPISNIFMHNREDIYKFNVRILFFLEY